MENARKGKEESDRKKKSLCLFVGHFCPKRLYHCNKFSAIVPKTEGIFGQGYKFLKMC